MFIILLNRDSLENLWDCIKDIKNTKKLIVFTSKEKQTTNCSKYKIKLQNLVKHLFIIENYDRSWSVEYTLYKKIATKNLNIKEVFAMAEYDLYRASKIREYYGIKGITPHETNLFRNKIAMKDFLVKNKINVAPYKEITSLYDIYKFEAEYKLPLIFKYQEAGGAVGTKVLKNFEDIKKLSQSILASNSFEWPKIMIEKFIFGTMYHVDGIANEKKILYDISSKYNNQGISYQDELNLGSIVLTKNNTISKKLLEINKKIVTFLPLSTTYGFHNEYFIDDKGEIILCEIAARIGGGAINRLNYELKGINLIKFLLNNLLNIEQNKKIFPKNMDKSGGWILYTPGSKKGEIINIDNSCPYDYVKYYKVSAKIGNTINPSLSCMHNLAYVVFEAENEDEAQIRLDVLEKWFYKNRKIKYIK